MKFRSWHFWGVALKFRGLLIIKHFSILPQKNITIFVDGVSNTQNKTYALPNMNFEPHNDNTARQSMATAMPLFDDGKH